MSVKALREVVQLELGVLIPDGRALHGEVPQLRTISAAVSCSARTAERGRSSFGGFWRSQFRRPARGPGPEQPERNFQKNFRLSGPRNT